MNKFKHHVPRVRRIGLAGSGVAMTALLSPLCAGSQVLGFGRSISEIGQRCFSSLQACC
jgi:hypothetical protein